MGPLMSSKDVWHQTNILHNPITPTLAWHHWAEPLSLGEFTAMQPTSQQAKICDMPPKQGRSWREKNKDKII